MSIIICSTQPSPRRLDLKDIPGVNCYIQLGKAKKNKQTPRVVVNPLNGLRNTRNKPRQMQLLSEAGLRVPQFFPRYRDVINFFEWEGNDKKVVGKLLNHSRARGIRLFNGWGEFEHFFRTHRPSNYYFQEFCNMNREWRIFVSRFHDDPVFSYRKCFRKETTEAYRNGDIGKPWVRNLENCYFKLHSESDKASWFSDIVQECKRGLEVLGMDIAGVDVGENTKVRGGSFVIYEFNSAPGMHENTKSCYEKAINEILEIKAKQKGLL